MTSALTVLFVTSECSPWSKTGGLADVSAGLPAALRSLGIDARILTPAYPSVPLDGAQELTRIPETAHFPEARLLSAEMPNGVPALLIDCPPLYMRLGGPYQDAAGQDWSDNAERFGQLSRVAAALAANLYPRCWSPQIVHCNDWQTGLVPAYLHFESRPHAPTVFTIHNLAFQGLFSPTTVSAVGLPPESFSMDGIEFYGHCSLLKAGLKYADVLTTVSPTYAQEIQQEGLGMGMQDLIRMRRDVLSGILNGIDAEIWNPATDPHIPYHYDAATLERKAGNKRALQADLKLLNAELPLFAMISRLTPQKGIDLVLEIGSRIAQLPAQLVILGRGDHLFEQAAAALARAHPQHISAIVNFDEKLAHLIEAGADAFLMPSRFEPCGLNQMYSQRYGTVPIVRASGGLRDSVQDYSQGSAATGFVFQQETAGDLIGAIERALPIYRDTPKWRKLQRAGMARDFSWKSAAARYIEIYTRLAKPKA